MESKPNFDTICLSGGGIKGFSFLGALDYLQSNSYIDLNLINNWIGTSAGSILSFLFTLGYSIHELGDFILDFNFSKLEPDVSIDNLLENHGIDNGSKLLYIIQIFLNEKYGVEDISFKKHWELTNKKLTIIGTNFTKGKEVAFNYLTTPEMSVITAVRISFSVPFFFTPVLYDSDYWVDGGFVNNFPIKYCNPETTLGIYIKYSCCNQLINIFSLISGCLSILADTVSNKDCERTKYRIIEIFNDQNDFINFNLDRDKKLKIINLGQIYAKKYIEEFKNIQSNDKSTQTD